MTKNVLKRIFFLHLVFAVYLKDISHIPKKMAPSRGQGGQKYSKCMMSTGPNLALVLLFERNKVECGKGL